jgi:hypothetical protein
MQVLMRNPRYQVIGIAAIAVIILAYTIVRFGSVMQWTLR